MKKIIIFLCLLFFSNVFSQGKLYKYYITVSNYREAPKFEKVGNKSFYVGKDIEFKNFIKSYDVIDFYQYVPGAPQKSLVNVFVINTHNESLANDLIKTFPWLFLSFEDMSGDVIELDGYPNDYGLTSPIGNSGASFIRKDLDYLNVHEAWDVPVNANTISIGISDARIKVNDADFVNKISSVNFSFQNSQYLESDQLTWHGTSVAAIAGAQGNNGYGSVGVCSECELVATNYGSYTNLLALADKGVRVINMSWTSTGRSIANQTIIDSLVNHYKIVLVASAGNRICYQTNEDFVDSDYDSLTNSFVPKYVGPQVLYPASYNGVISVGTVEHFYPVGDVNSIDSTSPTMTVAVHIEDSATPNLNADNLANPIAVKFNGWAQGKFRPDNSYQITSPNGIVGSNTMNEYVDILAPANKVMNYSKFAEEGIVAYHSFGGTSSSAPYVSGTAGLMLRVNNCLLPAEVDVILKVNAKDIENMPMNQDFHGIIGAGKLEVGNSVKFVDEMKKSNGNALIANHIFNRFNLTLSHINNQLSIENITFREVCIADFTARNVIFVNESDFKPNLSGIVDLKIDKNIDITCSNSSNIKNITIEKEVGEGGISQTKLFPNPNNGNFSIVLENLKVNNLSVIVYDILGKPVFQANNILPRYDLNLPNLASGMYFVKLSGDNYTETIKFIKN